MEPDFLDLLTDLIARAEKELERADYVAFVRAGVEEFEERQDDIDSEDLDD